MSISDFFKEYKFLLIILFLFILSYGLHFNGLKHDYPTNIDNYYGLTRSIVESGTLQRAEVLEICAKEPYSFECNDTEAISLGVNNKIYSRFPPGISFLGVPFYFVPYALGLGRTAKLASLVFLNTILSIILLFFIYKLCRIYTTKKNSRKIVYVFAFGTILFTYSQVFSSDILASLLIVMSFYYFLNFIRYKESKYAFLSGLPLGYIYITKPPLIFIPFLLFLVFLYHSFKEKNYKPCLIFLLGFCILFFIAGFYYLTAFGSFLKTGYQSTIDISAYAKTGEITTYAETGLLKNNPLIQAPLILLVVLLTSPFLLFSLINFKTFENKIVYLLLLAVIIFFGSFNSPFGSWCFGPRYQLPAILLLSVPLASEFHTLQQSRIKRKIFWILVVISILLNVLGGLNYMAWDEWTKLNEFLSRISSFS